MDEKEFINDVWDVLMGNTEYITQQQFAEKYPDMLYVDSEDKAIVLGEGYTLKLTKEL